MRVIIKEGSTERTGFGFTVQAPVSEIVNIFFRNTYNGKHILKCTNLRKRWGGAHLLTWSGDKMWYKGGGWWGGYSYPNSRLHPLLRMLEEEDTCERCSVRGECEAGDVRHEDCLLYRGRS